MGNRAINPTRKHGRHLRVPVLPEEESAIKSKAANAGLSIAEYLRRVGLGYEIRGILDQNAILHLVKINADLGRLGGLLKLWLTKDERLQAVDSRLIVTLLKRLAQTQQAMLEVVKKA